MLGRHVLKDGARLINEQSHLVQPCFLLQREFFDLRQSLGIARLAYVSVPRAQSRGVEIFSTRVLGVNEASQAGKMNQNNAKVPPDPTTVGPGGKYKKRKKSPVETPTVPQRYRGSSAGKFVISSERNKAPRVPPQMR